MCDACEKTVNLPQDAQSASLDIHRRKVAKTKNDGFAEQVRRRNKAKKVVERLLPQHSVSICGHYAISKPSKAGVKIWSDGETASISGVQRCGSADCPACAPLRASRNREDIQRVCNGMLNEGSSALMVTLTFRHKRYESLETLITFRSKALKRLRADGSFRRLMASYDHSGDIRVDEETHGKNGWHPHIHFLFFFNDLKPHNVEIFEAQFYAIWRRIVETTLDGRVAFKKAFSVEWVTTERVGEYLSKWDITYEMAYGHTKDQGAGRSYFQIVLDVADGVHGDYDEALIREHYLATKGKRRIGFSRGLKSRFAVFDRSDDDHADEIEAIEGVGGVADDAVREPVAVLTPALYRRVLIAGSLPDLLISAATNRTAGVVDVLDQLKIPWEARYGLYGAVPDFSLVSVSEGV